MLTPDEIFEHFDEGGKRFLTKHELNLALIYFLGYKIRYDELKTIWKSRFQYV